MKNGTPKKPKNNTLYTIGYSIRPVEAFVSLLKNNGVQCLVDIRTIPSLHSPQYEQSALSDTLQKRLAQHE